jgi:hypothetical protein
MSPLKLALLAASLVIVATGAQAQTIHTYIGGPKSGLTQSINVGGARAIGSDNGYSSYAQAVPVRPRVAVPATRVSGGVRAIGADSAYDAPVRRNVFHAVPPRRNGAMGLNSGAKAIGSDN